MTNETNSNVHINPAMEIPAIVIPSPSRRPVNKYATYEHLASIIHLNYTTYFQECEHQNMEYNPEVVMDSIENVLSRMIPELHMDIIEEEASKLEDLLYEGSSDYCPVRYHLEQAIATLIHTPENYVED